MQGAEDRVSAKAQVSMQRQRLTHKEMESILTDHMLFRGWERVRDRKTSVGKLNIDRLFKKDGHYAAFEIKPSYASRREILTGIGQCAMVLPFKNMSTNLFIDAGQALYVEPMLKHLPWLGLLLLNRKHWALVQVQKSGERTGTATKAVRPNHNNWKSKNTEDVSSLIEW